MNTVRSALLIVAGALLAVTAHGATDDAWPPSRDGIAFLWENGRSLNEARDAGTGETQQYTGLLHGRAIYGPHYELLLAGGSFRPSDVDGALLDACRRHVAVDDFTVPVQVHAKQGLFHTHLSADRPQCRTRPQYVEIAWINPAGHLT